MEFENPTLALGRSLFGFVSAAVPAILLFTTVTDLDFFVDAYRNVEVTGINFSVPISVAFPVVGVLLATAQVWLIMQLLRPRNAVRNVSAISMAVVTAIFGVALQLALIALFIKGQFELPLAIMRYAVIVSAAALLLARAMHGGALRWIISFAVGPAIVIATYVTAFQIARTPTEIGLFDPSKSEEFSLLDPFRTIALDAFYGKPEGGRRASLFSGTISFAGHPPEAVAQAIHSVTRYYEYRSFVGLDATSAPLDGLRFNNSDFTGATFAFAKLSGASFFKAKMRHSELIHANARGASFVFADLFDADLSRADLTFANFSFAEGALSKFKQARLDFASLDNAKLPLADFNEAIVHGTSFFGTRLWGANFDKASWMATSLARADLWRAWPFSSFELYRSKVPVQWPSDILFKDANFGPHNFASTSDREKDVEQLVTAASQNTNLHTIFEKRTRSLSTARPVVPFEEIERIQHSMGYDETLRSDGRAAADEGEAYRFALLYNAWQSFIAKTSQAAYYASVTRLYIDTSCGPSRLKSDADIWRIIERIRLDQGPWNVTYQTLSATDAANRIAFHNTQIKILEKLQTNDCLGPFLGAQRKKFFEQDIADARRDIDRVRDNLISQAAEKADEERRTRETRSQFDDLEKALNTCDPALLAEFERQTGNRWSNCDRK